MAPIIAPKPLARFVKNPKTKRPPNTPMNNPMILMKVSNKDLISGFTKTSPSKVPIVPMVKVVQFNKNHKLLFHNL